MALFVSPVEVVEANVAVADVHLPDEEEEGEAGAVRVQ